MLFDLGFGVDFALAGEMGRAIYLYNNALILRKTLWHINHNSLTIFWFTFFQNQIGSENAHFIIFNNMEFGQNEGIFFLNPNLSLIDLTSIFILQINFLLQKTL